MVRMVRLPYAKHVAPESPEMEGKEKRRKSVHGRRKSCLTVSLGDGGGRADSGGCRPKAVASNSGGGTLDGGVACRGLCRVLCVVDAVGLGEEAGSLGNGDLVVGGSLGGSGNGGGGSARGAEVDEPALLLLGRAGRETKLHTPGVGEVLGDLVLLPLVGTDCLGRGTLGTGDSASGWGGHVDGGGRGLGLKTWSATSTCGKEDDGFEEAHKGTLLSETHGGDSGVLAGNLVDGLGDSGVAPVTDRAGHSGRVGAGDSSGPAKVSDRISSKCCRCSLVASAGDSSTDWLGLDKSGRSQGEKGNEGREEHGERENAGGFGLRKGGGLVGVEGR